MPKAKKISAEIIADSLNEYGNRITTFLLTYPRFIHGELMTHRMFSRNSMSSRAIPFNKMVELVREDPFIPIAFQKHHKGMQGTEYFEPGTKEYVQCINNWEKACHSAILEATNIYESGVTKQLANRILEPFQWHTVLVTATEYDNFFELRLPRYESSVSRDGKTWKIVHHHSKKDFAKDNPEIVDEYDYVGQNKSHAEIHIQTLAEAMWDARNESNPKKLKAGQWHIPFGDRIDESKIISPLGQDHEEYLHEVKLKISVARCARLSYNTHDGKIDYEKDLELYDTLLNNNHASPFEHCARAMTKEEFISYVNGYLDWNPGGDHIQSDAFLSFSEDSEGWSRNFKGFIQYRDLINL